jgi:hypothetical protein
MPTENSFMLLAWSSEAYKEKQVILIEKYDLSTQTVAYIPVFVTTFYYKG